MKKNDLLADLNVLYKAITPPNGNPELVETVGLVKRYLFYFLEIGKGRSDGTPVAYKRFIPFYVWNEGAADEAAYYEQQPPTNSVDQSFSAVNAATPTLFEIVAAFNSVQLRQKVLAALLNAAFSIFWEALATPNHAIRMKWAVNTQSAPAKSLDQAMSVLALDASILSGNPTDAQVQGVINGYIDKWAVTLYT